MNNKILLFLIILINQINAQTVGLLQYDSSNVNDGYFLFAPSGSNITYLIDRCGNNVKTWTSSYLPGQAVYLLDDGNLLRTGNTDNTTFNAGGKGGIIEKIDWNGNVTWSYTISDNLKCSHHDIKILPNGNVLVVVWENKTYDESINAGLNPLNAPENFWSEGVYEIQPVGTNSGNIVWEWHLWDHIIQNLDPAKNNYSLSISNNPQLVNINYNVGSSVNPSDWIHINSIDFNPTLNQIILSAHNFNEIWIIDHSTTTEQASSHLGGNSGNGGDLLFRWGNPQAYNIGSTSQLFGQHNARWIESGFPFENEIMIFNNGLNRPGGQYSTVEIIRPPVIGFNYDNTILPYAPTNPTWIYNSNNTHNFFGRLTSGAQPLPNGNVILCNGPNGTFKEINNSGNDLWKYKSPVNNTTTIASQGTLPIQNLVFRCTFYPTNYSGFIGHNLINGGTIENNNSLTNSCNSYLLSSNNNNLNDGIKIYPNPAIESIKIEWENSINISAPIRLINNLGQTIFSENVLNNKNISIPVNNLSSGIYLLKINTDNKEIVKKVIIN